jgi:hypothetical protein
MFYSCSFIYLIILVGNLNLFIFYRQQVDLRRLILHIIIWLKTFGFFFSCSFVAPKEIDTSYGSRLYFYFFIFFLFFCGDKISKFWIV